MTHNSLFPHWPESPAGYQLCLYKHKIGKRCDYFLIHSTLMVEEHLKIRGKNDSFLSVQNRNCRSVLSLWFLVSRQSLGLGIWLHLWGACLTCSKPWVSPQLCTNQSRMQFRSGNHFSESPKHFFVNRFDENRKQKHAHSRDLFCEFKCRQCVGTDLQHQMGFCLFVYLFVWFTEEEKISRILGMPQSRASKTFSTSSTFLYKNFSVISILFVLILG